MSILNAASGVGGWRPLSVAESLRELLVAETRRLLDLRPAPRRERLAALHNPWSNTAVASDRWAFLDLCESAEAVRPVTEIIGPDVVLWDSQLYLRGADFTADAAREGRYWPVYPKAGAVVLVSFADPVQVLHAPLADVSANPIALPDPAAPLYVIRYFPGASKFVREPRYPANWLVMEEQVLLNYTTRALWLVAGEDRAGNDFVTGFAEQSPRWKPSS